MKPNAKPVKIMIVDDEAEVLRTLERILRRRGHPVAAFSTPVSALEYLSREAVDLIFTDLKMPELDGNEFLVQAKKIRPHTPVVLVTAFASIDTAVTAIQNGAFDYLKKPFNLHDIDEIVQKALCLNDEEGPKSQTSWLLPCVGVFLLLTASGCATPEKRSARSWASPPPRVAVLPFDSGNAHISGSAMSDYFTVAILQSIRDLHVIERKDMITILEEQKLTLSGITRQEKFIQLGSLLGVDSILIGSVQTAETLSSGGGSISVLVKLMEVSTGKVMWADRETVATATWSPREIPEIAQSLMEKAAKKMVGKLEKRLPLEWAPAEQAQSRTPVIREARLPSDPMR